MKRNIIIHSDVLDYLATLPDDSVDCVVTSPPYWQQRDYSVNGQIGLEETFDEFLDTLVIVFWEVKRVMKPTATLWVNMGDKMVNKQMVGQPWRLAFALQERVKFWLRSDIIWHKPNPMPSSVTDRPTKAHEYIFLLTKRGKYFYDADAVRESQSDNPASVKRREHRDSHKESPKTLLRPGYKDFYKYTPNRILPAGRNKRTVWTVATQPYSGAHFATFPEKLIEPCILAGCPREVCAECGAPVERVTDTTEEYKALKIQRQGTYHYDSPDIEFMKGNKFASATGGLSKPVITTGWRATCECNAPTRPGLVLDPFMGSGTTAIVARRHDRDYIGCDVSQEYVDMAQRRLADSDPYEATETDVGEVQLSLFG